MRRLSDFVLSLFCFAIAVMPAFAGTNRWSGTSPGLAIIARVTSDPSDPSLLYAVTTAGGILKSTDGGSSWKAANEGLSALSISEFLIKPGAAGTVFLASKSDVFISTDAADHFTKVGTIPGGPVTTMAFDPGSGLLLAGTPAGVHVSSDNGRTWTNAGELGFIRSIVVSPKGTILAVAMGFGLYGSSDHGKTWSLLHGGFDAVVAADQNSTLYLFDNTNGFSVSADEGRTWRQIAGKPNLGSLRVSLNAGGGALINSNVSTPAPGDVLVLGTTGTIAEYTASTGLWRDVAPPIPGGTPLSMAVLSSAQRKYWVATAAGGLLVSVGGEWTVVGKGLGGAHVNDVAVADSSPSTACAATDSGVFRTADRGANWTEITPPGVTKRALSVQIDPSRSDTVYASTDQVYKSTDSGSSWTGIKRDQALFLSISPTDPATLYAILSQGLNKSTDRGQTWLYTATGLSAYLVPYYGGATSLAEDPANGDTVYLGTGAAGLYRVAPDSSKMRVSPELMRALAIGPNESVVYAAPDAGAVLKTADRGTTWSTAGLIDKKIRALLLTGPDHSVLYAGSFDGHVYRSTDAGQSWQGIDQGLDRVPIRRLASDRTGDVLYVAFDRGVREYEAVKIQLDALPDDPLRFAGLLNRAAGDSLVVLPVGGTATGATGIVYTTAVTLANSRDATQDVILTWVPQAGGGVRSFHMTLPPSSDASNGLVTIPDLAQFLGVSGIGSLAIAGVDATGNADPSASISASADIWSHPPDLRAPFSQSLNAIPRETVLGHTQSTLSGLQHDAAFRTNIGIVNLSADAHSYAVAVQGERASSDFTVSVPSYALFQIALPEKDYGALTIRITADASANWVSYGSTINRATGEARTSAGN